ncbi:MAG TPA: SpoIIE family protein phosphatase [bacterium]
MWKAVEAFFQDSKKVRALFTALIGVVLIYSFINFRNLLATATDQNIFEDTDQGVTVKAVKRGGASDRAGIRVGDVIVSINGRRFHNAVAADRILRDIEAGRTVEYLVQRAGQEIIVPITLATIGIDIYLVSLLLIGFSSIGTAAFFGLLRPHLPAARLLFATFLTWSILLLGQSLRFSHTTVVQLTSVPVFILLVFYSRLYFPVLRSDILARRSLLKAFAIAAVTVAVIMNAILILFILQKIKFNILWSILLNGAVVALVLFGILIFFAHRKTKPPEAKRLARYLKWSGWFVGLTFLAVTALAIWFKIEWIICGQYAFIVLILFPLSHLYTTYRFRLLEFNPVIRRSRLYVSIAALINLALFVILLLGIGYLPKLRMNYPGIWFTDQQIEIGFVDDLPPEKREHWKIKATVVETILFIFVLWRLRIFLQNQVARKFHQEKYDYKKALAEFSGIVACCLDEKRLAHDVIEKLSGLMRLKNIGILLSEDGKMVPANAYGFRPDAWQSLAFRRDAPWIRQLTVDGRPHQVDGAVFSEHPHLKELGAAFLTPIMLNGRLLGMFVVGEKLSEDHYRIEDLELLEAAASQTAVALENINLYKELKNQERFKNELQIAHRIQLSSLPKQVPNLAGLDIFAHSEPATEVGGDYYDFLLLDKKQLLVVVGDVSGKGTSAALYVSKIQGIMRSIYEYHPSPRDLFIRLNYLLTGDLERTFFITQVGGKFDLRARKLTLVRAGQEPVIHYDARKKVAQALECQGMGLGLGSPEEFARQTKSKSLSLKTGDIFVFYTDGVTDAQNQAGEEFGCERLQQIVHQMAGEPATQIGQGIMSAVEQHTAGCHRFDDLTVCVVKVK